MELGEQIATLREEQALTQAELAEAARISPSTLSQIESGRVPSPHVGTVRKIARALGVEPAELRRAKEPVPLGEAPREAGPPRVCKERLQEHFEDVQQNEVDYLNEVIADLWRLALPDEKPRAHFVPDDVDPGRAWGFLEHAFAAGNVFVPEERERLNRGARKFALTGGG